MMARHTGSTPHARVQNPEAVAELLRRSGLSREELIEAYRARFGVSGEASYRRVAERDITYNVADHWATLLGSHLAIVAPEAYAPDVDASMRFSPARDRAAGLHIG
jgi:hypothetical protein